MVVVLRFPGDQHAACYWIITELGDLYGAERAIQLALGHPEPMSLSPDVPPTEPGDGRPDRR
jgi:hypothetical protein